MKPDERTWALWGNDGINEEEAELLRAVAAELPIPLDEEAGRDVETLVDAFIRRNDAVGLAAPQIGISKRVIVFRSKKFGEKTPLQKDGGDYEVLVNPRITQYQGDEEQDSEGCLSCPDINADVVRWTEIKVRAFDRDGNKISRRYTGYLARVVQHEMDHLDGMLFLDRVVSISTGLFRRKNYA